jgi:hypothetical protein
MVEEFVNFIYIGEFSDAVALEETLPVAARCKV